MVILGAGGAARAAAGALADAGGEIRIVNRTRGRAEGLARRPVASVTVAGDSGRAFEGAAAVINAPQHAGRRVDLDLWTPRPGW